MASKPPKIPAEPLPYTPAQWELHEATALQALAMGKADAEQQQVAINWILHKACGTYDLEYRADGRDHAFVSGRRFVGLEIVKLLKVAVPKFVKK